MYRYCLEKFDVGHSWGSKGGALLRAAQVQILALMPLCVFSPLLQEAFLQVFQFSPLLKNQPFQISI